MDELLKVLEDARSILAWAQGQQKSIAAQKASLDARDKALTAEVLVVKDAQKDLENREKALATLASQYDLAVDLHAKRADAEQALADVENLRAKMMEQVNALQIQAQEALQQAGEIRLSAESLQKAVEKEKAEYKTKILEDLATRVRD